MKTLIILLLTGLACLLVSCASRPSKAPVPADPERHIIYLVYHHWHTSIILEASQLAQHSPLLASYMQGEDWVRVGWGDGDYFTGQSKSWGAATRALLVSGYSALQVLTYSADELQQIPTATRVPLAISQQGLLQLLKAIEASLALDPQLQPQPLPAVSLDGQDIGIFLRAKGHYSLLHNCNSWSAEALQLAGLPLVSRLTAQGVFRQAQQISLRQAEAGLFTVFPNGLISPAI